MRAGSASRVLAKGFTYVWVMATVVIMSIGLAVAGPLWADHAQRDREEQLLRVGVAYAEAIANYRRSSPGAKQWPHRLEDLLEDKRHIGTVRHLRYGYPDPMSPTGEWGLIEDPDDGIRGVYSKSSARPFRRGPFAVGAVALGAAERYSDWRFVANVEARE